MILNCLYDVEGVIDSPINIIIKHGKIHKVISTAPEEVNNQINIKFDNALVFPSLVNSHDHLDFNSFPQLGNKTHQDYVGWATYIQNKYQEEILKVLDVPLQERIQKGIYKNLFNGISHVVNHGKWHQEYNHNLVDVVSDVYNLHSVHFEKSWKIKLNFARLYHPAVIHVGEGITPTVKDEIDSLIKWNLFKRKVIGIHGISMNLPQASHFEALIWCPDSNLRLYNKTSAIEILKQATPILFGTDSTLSAGWNFWDHLRVARKLNKLDDKELFDSIISTPKTVWKLNSCKKIKEGESADLVIAKRKKQDKWDAFYALNPEDILMIVKRGLLIYFDESMLPHVKGFDLNNFTRILFNNIPKYVKTDEDNHSQIKSMNF